MLFIYLPLGKVSYAAAQQFTKYRNQQQNKQTSNTASGFKNGATRANFKLKTYNVFIVVKHMYNPVIVYLFFIFINC